LGALIYLQLAGFHQSHSFQDRLPITEQCSIIFLSSIFNGSDTQLDQTTWAQFTFPQNQCVCE
jgi:hypothetical protein